MRFEVFSPRKSSPPVAGGGYFGAWASPKLVGEAQVLSFSPGEARADRQHELEARLLDRPETPVQEERLKALQAKRDALESELQGLKGARGHADGVMEVLLAQRRAYLRGQIRRSLETLSGEDEHALRRLAKQQPTGILLSLKHQLLTSNLTGDGSLPLSDFVDVVGVVLLEGDSPPDLALFFSRCKLLPNDLVHFASGFQSLEAAPIANKINGIGCKQPGDKGAGKAKIPKKVRPASATERRTTKAAATRNSGVRFTGKSPPSSETGRKTARGVGEGDRTKGKSGRVLNFSMPQEGKGAWY